ncbi:MAG TPA: response regulator, partial [Flavisolibacter sp.]|nr:response regulator [Flavisolibacter sp.]
MEEKIKVLLVDDNEDELHFMKEGFLASGLYEIIGEAESGDQLLTLMQHPSALLPQVVVSDLNMPGLNGYEVIQEVKTDPSLQNISIVVLSNAPYVPFAEKCKKLGACLYFTKPETFLDYENFARKIYGAVKAC